MISGWRYDDGKPHYMEAINRWTEPHDPCWRCGWLVQDNIPEIHIWLQEHGSKGIDYDVDCKFNSGNPHYYLRIYDDTMAVAFRLRWL